jgi:ADP-heptose:LPS heptosyltransferase
MTNIYLKTILGLKFNILRVLCFLFFRSKYNKSPKNIIVFRTCLLGDFIFSLPAVNQLKQNFPDAKIYYITTYASSGVVKFATYVNKNELLPWFEFIKPSLVKDVISLQSLSLRCIRETRSIITDINPDLVILLPHPGDPLLGIFKKILLFKMLGINRNVFGWKVKGDYSFLRKQQNDLGLFGHKIFGPLRAVSELSNFYLIKKTEIKFPININENKIIWANEYIKNHAKPNILNIGLAVGSVQKHKQWPIQNFVKLAEQLDQKYDITFFIFGTRNDEGLYHHFETSIFKNKLVNLIGKTEISQLAALLQRMDVLVTNDGGTAHLGAAVNCKVLSIISGIEYPNSIEPWGNFDYVVRHEVPCSPCYSMTFCPLNHNACIKEISVEKVYNKFNSIISDYKLMNIRTQ